MRFPTASELQTLKVATSADVGTIFVGTEELPMLDELVRLGWFRTERTDEGTDYLITPDGELAMRLAAMVPS